MRTRSSIWECDICKHTINVEPKNAHEQWYVLQVHPVTRYLNDPTGDKSMADWDVCSVDCLNILVRRVATLVPYYPQQGEE